MRILILAGGKGRRLWPLSKESLPKQFHTFFSGKSLLQCTIDRFIDQSFVDQIVVCTNTEFRKIVEKQCRLLPIDIVFENAYRNTTSAIALSIKFLEKKGDLSPDEPICILPSDHYIEPISIFLEAIQEQFSPYSIVTFGIQPTKEETGYGYMEIDPTCADVQKIRSFIEKPGQALVHKMILSKRYLWNSGVFLLTSRVFWKEIEKFCPSLYQISQLEYSQFLDKFSTCPSISFDHAVMEKTDKGYCYPLKVHWSDVGTWDSIYEIMQKDNHANVKIGNIVDLDTKNSLFIGHKKMISTIGLKDIIFIETENEIFLAKKGKGQDMKRLLELINIQKKKAIT